MKFFAPINSEPVPEFLAHRDEILADPNIKNVITKYYNSQQVWRKLRIGKLKQGHTTIRSIVDLRFAGVYQDYLKIQVKYDWYFGNQFNIDYSDYGVITMKKVGGAYDILSFELGARSY